jgi:excisionase family DNA binding protein
MGIVEASVRTVVPVTESEDLGPSAGRSISIDGAAERLGVSRRTIYNHIRNGLLQTVRVRGGSQRVLIDSVLLRRATTARDTTR